MKDEFDIPTGDIVRDYEMLTCETFSDYYGDGSDLEKDLTAEQEDFMIKEGMERMMEEKWKMEDKE